MEIRSLYDNYKSEILFGLALITLVLLSFYGSTFIPALLYTDGISQILNGCVATVGLLGSMLIWRHHDGMRARKFWAFVLLVWTILATLLLLRFIAYNVNREETGVLSLHGWELLIGNFYAWLLLLYPAEVLRPGWLNIGRALRHLLPVFLIAAIDHFFTIDLRWMLALYPVVLLGFLAMHVRAYRVWCEQNYSSMEHIDAQWIVRYMIMYLICGGAYIYMSVTTHPTRAFTLQWLLLFMLVYSTEQILFRPDPWKIIRRRLREREAQEEDDDSTAVETDEQTQVAYRATLEQWMRTDKPYLNPDFRLMDLREVLPLNRTYLSALINSAYGCNFYQFVTNYRINEAKQLMREHPEMQLQEVAERSGFSSPTVFSRIFARETGMTPREWSAKK